MSRIKPDYIFHMAAYGVDSRQKDYVTAAETNIIGTINLVKTAAEIGCEKLLNTGTSMQYGNKMGAIKEEDYYDPTNIYGSTKGAATIVAHQIARENNLDIVTIIPFGVFGEKEGSHKFFPHVILSSLGEGEVKLSPCRQYRDYCYIENIVDGFLMAAAKREITNEVFNIGSGAVYQLKHYVGIIMKKLNIDKKVNYGAVEYRKNDLWSPQPDLTRIGAQLEWQPRVSLEEGIDRTIYWFKENIDEYSVRGR
jgi:nucleoside-diphosphate-sugar epimerase